MSGSSESTDSFETTKINQADKQKTVRQVFKKLMRDHNKSKYPNEEDLEKLNSFLDVINEDFFGAALLMWDSRRELNLDMGWLSLNNSPNHFDEPVFVFTNSSKRFRWHKDI
jgi:hypothetical protein